MPLYLKTSTATNAWREALVYLKTSTATNSWRKIVSAFIKTADGWKLIFGSVGPQIDFPLEISSNSNLYPAVLTGKNYHWDSGDSFDSKFQKASSISGPWSDVTTFQFIANPPVGSFNTSSLTLLESHFILNQSSTFFRFVVRAQDSTSGKETTEFSDPIEITVPDAVMSHTGGPIVATSTTISIPFTQNSFLKYYIVEAYGPSGLVSSTRVNTPSSPVVVQNLLPNTTYDIVIFPYNFVDMVGTALLAIGITTLAPAPGPVTNLTRSTGNGGSKTFTWSAPTTGGSVTSYEYQLNNLGFINNGSSTSVSLTGLSGTNTFQVRAVGPGGTGTSVSTGSFIIPTINSGPTGGSITSSGATVSWTSTNQSSYSLSVPGATGTPFTGTTATSRSLSLSSSTTYTPTLTITSSTGDTATTTGPSFTTLAPAPSPPTINSSSSTTTSITLNFTLGANSTSTRAYINGSFDGNTTGTSYTFFGLSSGTSYNLQLFGFNGVIESSTSSGGIFSTQAAQYTVTWNANGGTVSPTSSVFSQNGFVVAPTPSRSGYTFNGWYNTPSGDYLYGPIAAGSVWYPPNQNITMYARWTLIVSVPSGGSVSLSGNNTAGSVITASTSGWSGSPTFYDVFITTALSPNIPTSSNSRVAQSNGGTSCSYTITSSDALSPVNIFRAFATASNSAGTSSVVQSPNTITTQASVSVPATPTNVSLSVSGLVSWTASSGATSYTVEYYLASSSSGANAYGPLYSSPDPTGTTYQIAYQTVGGTLLNYARARVRANNSAGSSAYSAFAPASGYV